MAHFTIIAPPFTRPVRALAALAGGSLDKGHRISWLHQADVQPLLGALTHPAGALARTVARAARPDGPLGLHRVIADVAVSSDMLCRQAPALLRPLGSDAVIAHQMKAAGELVASGLGLPFMSVACALPVNREPRLPLPVMPWACATDARGEQLNDGSARVQDGLMQPHARVTARHARAFGIGPRSRLADCLSAAQAKALQPAGATWVTGFAPQRAALARADAVISHTRPLGADVAASSGLPGAVGLIQAALVKAARCAPPFTSEKEPAHGAPTAAAAQAARRQHA